MKKVETSEKYTNQNELKSQTKRIISDVETGERYFVLRYSDPVAVLLSIEDYCKLTNQDPTKCNKCQADIKATLAKINKKL
ncbi:type II toxin-antitoxin system Phd/YefM family antitoxin [Patescibacteria group bacterium]